MKLLKPWGHHDKYYWRVDNLQGEYAASISVTLNLDIAVLYHWQLSIEVISYSPTGTLQHNINYGMATSLDAAISKCNAELFRLGFRFLSEKESNLI